MKDRRRRLALARQRARQAWDDYHALRGSIVLGGPLGALAHALALRDQADAELRAAVYLTDDQTEIQIAIFYRWLALKK